jgi:hypothetical protein
MVREWLRILVCCAFVAGLFCGGAQAQAPDLASDDSAASASDSTLLDFGSDRQSLPQPEMFLPDIPHRRVPDCAPMALAFGIGAPNLPGRSSTATTNNTCADSSSSSAAPQDPEVFTEGVHWGPVFKQSLEFLLLEHGFRLADGGFTRYLLMHKPFWDDWAASLQHFDMHRWGDGDPFIINYIGHPMEGAVSGDIFIQNDPRGRMQRFGKSSGYWKSRLKAMGWAALYSAYFETGPVLSEAAIGNEGGFTYVPGCGNSPCSKPGKVFKPQTNNTGWVDFVVTPTIGMGWIVLEDAIEAAFVDRLAGDSPKLRWKILRGSLSPSRSLSNVLQWKRPWYRPWLDSNLNGNYRFPRVASSHPGEESSGSSSDMYRRVLGIHYVNLSLPMAREGCQNCRVANSGFGATFASRLSQHFWFDSELNYFPGGGAHGEKGMATEGLFGIRYGYTGRVWNFYAKARPGFIYESKTQSYPTGGQFVSLNRFAMDFGVIVEMKASQRSALRLDAGTTFVRYLQGLDPRQPGVAVISPNYIATQGNFQVATGYVYRF